MKKAAFVGRWSLLSTLATKQTPPPAIAIPAHTSIPIMPSL